MVLPHGAGGLADIHQKIAQTAAERERMEAEAVAALRIGPSEAKSSDVMMKHLRQLAKESPQTTAQLLRTWLQESKR